MIRTGIFWGNMFLFFANKSKISGLVLESTICSKTFFPTSEEAFFLNGIFPSLGSNDPKSFLGPRKRIRATWTEFSPEQELQKLFAKTNKYFPSTSDTNMKNKKLFMWSTNLCFLCQPLEICKFLVINRLNRKPDFLLKCSLADIAECRLTIWPAEKMFQKKEVEPVQSGQKYDTLKLIAHLWIPSYVRKYDFIFDKTNLSCTI